MDLNWQKKSALTSSS